MKFVVLDSNVFISAVKKDEEFSEASRKIISRIGADYLLVEPAIIFAELANAIARNVGQDAAEKEIGIIRKLMTLVVECDSDFCSRAGLNGAKVGIHSLDALYFETALEQDAPLISLDMDFLKKSKREINAFHVSDFR